MTLRPIYTQGELTAFIPEPNSDVTAGVAHHASEAVASRSDHLSPDGPAGTAPIAYVMVDGPLSREQARRVKCAWSHLCQRVGEYR